MSKMATRVQMSIIRMALPYFVYRVHMYERCAYMYMPYVCACMWLAVRPPFIPFKMEVSCVVRTY